MTLFHETLWAHRLFINGEPLSNFPLIHGLELLRMGLMEGMKKGLVGLRNPPWTVAMKILIPNTVERLKKMGTQPGSMTIRSHIRTRTIRQIPYNYLDACSQVEFLGWQL